MKNLPSTFRGCLCEHRQPTEAEAINDRRFQIKVNTSAAKRSFFTKNALCDSNKFMSRSKSSTLFKRALTSKEVHKREMR